MVQLILKIFLSLYSNVLKTRYGKQFLTVAGFFCFKFKVMQVDSPLNTQPVDITGITECLLTTKLIFMIMGI